MKRIIAVITLLVISSSCDEDFLNRVPQNSINQELVFEDEALVQANLNDIIGELPTGLYDNDTPGYGQDYMLASITDEARSKSGWVSSNTTVIKGALTPVSTPGLGIWNDAYTNIRKVNDLIKGLETSSLDENFIASVVAQARFCRAVFYFDLNRRYGGVPLVKEAQELTENPEDLFVPRSSTAEVYDFISVELSTIESQLENRSELPSGSISKQAALAFNARTLLYAERWAEAAAMADRIISGADNDGIDLFAPNPGSPEEAVENLRELFQSHGGNIEAVLEKQFVVGIRNHRFARGNWPVRWRSDNGGQTDPTQEIVDAFEMQATGLPITDITSGYDPDQPYTGRDPRFEAAIYYHGSPGPEGVAPRSGEPFIDMEWDNNNEGPGDVKDGNASITGYLVRKFVDGGDGFAPETSDIAYQNIRFAEVLLIFAEAENEANGPGTAVYNAINRIRTRAAMPDLPPGLSQSEMRDAIRHERRIELVFEGHRWFDLIRWEIAEEVLDGYQPKGVRIERKPGAPGKEDMPQLFDQTQFTYTYFDVGGRNQTFPASHNLLPIPQGEIDKFPTLIQQNPGY